MIENSLLFTFYTSTLTLTNEFNETSFFAREQHVCQQISEKKTQREKNLQFKLKSIFTENHSNGQS